MSRRSKRPALPPDETPDQLRARLRGFALATRGDAIRADTVPFPEHVSVLAGPLGRPRGARPDGTPPLGAPADEGSDGEDGAP